jgi:hypothetical protein
MQLGIGIILFLGKLDFSKNLGDVSIFGRRKSTVC